jgi:hypothetical protein
MIKTMSERKTVRTDVRTSVELKEKFKKYCTDRGISMSDSIIRHMELCVGDIDSVGITLPNRDFAPSKKKELIGDRPRPGLLDTKEGLNRLFKEKKIGWKEYQERLNGVKK